jgi:hypothetical protein
MSRVVDNEVADNWGSRGILGFYLRGNEQIVLHESVHLQQSALQSLGHCWMYMDRVFDNCVRRAGIHQVYVRWCVSRLQ